MPKMKTHKGAAKRFGVSGTGKVMRVKAWSGHHLDIKSSSRTRRYAGKSVVDATSAEQVRGLLPYLAKKKG
jgi:large subunit ribosomal protein L35